MNGTDPTLLSGAATEVDGDEAYCSACGRSFPADTDVCPNDGARLVKLAAQHDDLIGKRLDNRYEIRAPLGKGGMGTVYRGWQLSVDREVAIKVIHPRLASDRAIVKRFLREARIASRLSQPNIVNVYDFGQSEQVLYLVMELLRGHTLSTELGGGRRIDLRRTAVIAAQLCDALEAAHAQGIVHRDLKPGNIMILDDPPGRDLIKVLDFGLAKSFASETDGTGVTSTSAIIGTPLYMAPEQIEGKQSDQRADLYSLGCILYEMVSGAAPFVDAVVSAVLARHIADTPAPLPSHVPGPLRALIEKLLEKNPDDRLRGAGEVRQVLQTVAESSSVRLNTPVPPIEIPDTMPDLQRALAETDMALATHAQVAASVAAASSQPQMVSMATTPSAGKSPRYAVIAFFAIVPLGVLAFVMFRSNAQQTATPPALPGTHTDDLAGRPDEPSGGGAQKGFADVPPALDAGMLAQDPTPDAALIGGTLPPDQTGRPPTAIQQPVHHNKTVHVVNAKNNPKKPPIAQGSGSAATPPPVANSTDDYPNADFYPPPKQKK